MSHSLLNAVAIPEAENALAAAAARDLRAGAEQFFSRMQQIADDLALAHGAQAVDWEQDLAGGRGPCLALGAERRSSPR